MKLSMWILADWLKNYNPRAVIKEGSQTITGVRIIEDAISEFPRDYAYITSASEPFDGPVHRGTIMIIHGYDHIFLSNANTETIINEVLAAFDYYNDWEAHLREASVTEGALQKMITLSDDVFDNPIRIMDMDGKLLAISKKFGPDDVDQRWKKIYETGFVQIRAYGTPVITIEGEHLPEWEETPRRYYTEGKELYYIAAGLAMDDEIVAAFLVEEFTHTLTLADCQLATVFCKTLLTALQIRERSQRYITAQSRISIVSELLDGKPAEESYAKRLAFEDTNETLSLIALRSIREHPPKIRTGSILTAIRESGTKNISLSYEEVIVSVINQDDTAAFMEILSQAVNFTHYTLGISLPFKGWDTLPRRYKQASFAIAMAHGKAGVYNCETYAYKFLVGAISDVNASWEFCHPGVYELKLYDEQHGTEFYETLRCFIANERSYTRTSQAMFIHRSTLLYRVKRICELLKSSLDDPDERAFIYLSYELLGDA